MNSFSMLLKDTFIIGFGNIFSKGIIFFLIPLQTSVMTTADYGLAEILFNLVNVLIPIFTLGIAEAGMRFSINSNLEQQKSILQTITIIPIIGGILLSGFLMFGKIYYSEYQSYFSQLVILYFVFSLKDIYLQYIKGINKLKLFSIGSIVFATSLFALSYYFLVIKDLRVKGYFDAYILANLITIIFVLYRGKFYKQISLSKRYFNKNLFQSMLLYSIPLVSNLLAWGITSISNRYILAYYQNLNEVGIYSALVKFSLILTTIYGVFFQSWQINAAKNIYGEHRSKFFTKVHDYYLCALVIGSSLFIIVSESIASIFIRGDFTNSYQYLPGIILTGTACCLPMYWGAIYGALKDTKGAFYSTIIGSITSIVLNFYLISKYGIYGAIISTIISYFVVTVYRMITLNIILKIKLYPLKHLSGLIILGLQAMYYVIFDNLIKIEYFYFLSFITILFIYKHNINEFFYFLKRSLIK